MRTCIDTSRISLRFARFGLLLFVETFVDEKRMMLAVLFSLVLAECCGKVSAMPKDYML